MAHRTIAIGNPPGAGVEPVARVCLDDSVSAALTEVAAALPQTEFTPALLETLRIAYEPGTGMADAFGRWMESVLGSRGLIVYNSADPAAKPLVADLFAREIERAGETARLATEAGAAMEARGYTAQVTPHPDTVALFHLNAARQPIRTQGGSLVVGETVESKGALLERVRRAPGEFSPNVLLRPLVQDTLFPTVCYVAGPNELAYLGQLRGVYEQFSVPMPLMFPRTTATLLDSAATRFLTKYNVPFEELRTPDANAARFLVRHDVQLEQLQAQDEALLNRLLEAQLPPGVDAAMQEVSTLLQERMEQLATSVTEIDATLEGATRSALGRMHDDVRKLHGKIIQAAKRKDETLRRQFHNVQAQAFPGGDPQERAVGFVHFLNKYGPTLVDRLLEELPTDMGVHWVITP